MERVTEHVKSAEEEELDGVRSKHVIGRSHPWSGNRPKEWEEEEEEKIIRKWGDLCLYLPCGKYFLCPVYLPGYLSTVALVGKNLELSNRWYNKNKEFFGHVLTVKLDFYLVISTKLHIVVSLIK